MKKLLDALTKAENLIMIATFAVMVIASFAQVVNRNFLKLPITWFDEAAIYCMIYMVLIGTEVGIRDGTQIAVTGIVDRLKGRAKLGVQLAAKLVVILFAAVVFVGSLRLVDLQAHTGQVSAALGLPMAVPYAAMVISFGMITLVQAMEAVALAVALLQNKKGEEKA